MSTTSHGVFTNRNIDPDVDPMYWLMPVGALVGVGVVTLFNYSTLGFSMDDRAALFQSLKASGTPRQDEDGEEEMDEEVFNLMARSVDGLTNVWDFWSGGSMLDSASKENMCKAYEMLALGEAPNPELKREL